MNSRLNIYCIPFAGGNRYSYRTFEEHASVDLRIIPLELPGRGSRLAEPLLTSMEDVVDDVYNTLRKQNIHTPYAIFGHSMGALIAFLVIHKLSSQNLPLPIRLFVTGRQAPSCIITKITYDLPQAEFYQEVRSIGGTLDVVLQDRSLMEMYEPILRADFQAVETCEYLPRRQLNIPITAMIGSEEKTTYEHVTGWQKETTKNLEILIFQGNHFFIYEHAKRIVSIIHSRMF